METIKQLINQNKIEEALSLLDKHILLHPSDDEAFFVRGNIWRKKNNFRLAMNNYLEAITINPESPAQEAYDNLVDILNFYNKDMFNQ